MNARLFRLGLYAILASAGSGSTALAQNIALDELVVTATGRPELRTHLAGTTQVIDKEQIRRSTATSVTDLLAESAVGFFSQWSPGQTSINIRGAATDGQGRDFRSQILVLINGHRAGTANLSKLSPADVERIEIVRGPSSVIYGSQNMGGVINIIMKTGLTAPGTFVEGMAGSWDLYQGRLQNGGVRNGIDWYAGINGGTRGDYHVGGGGREFNTPWNRAGATASLGYQINETNRVDFNARTDGIYDAGFRGSAANIFNKEDRFNRSFDFAYQGRTKDSQLDWYFQTYGVTDVDDFRYAVPSAGTTLDHNRRQQDIVGARAQPRVRPFEGNELLLGWDTERSWLRSDRLRRPTAASPQDNNQSEEVNAFYFEDAQRLFGDRVIVRGGVRKTYGTTSFDPTPNLTNQVPGQKDYQATTYATGASYQALEWLSFRVGASSGFRAPTATDLAANFIATPIGNFIFGNPNLQPETAEQIEAGATVLWNGSLRFDAAVFQNIISDRITTLRRGTSNISDTINNPGNILVQGVEFQLDTDVLKTFGVKAGPWRWSVFGNGYYNFHMVDEGAPATANTTKPQRIYQYQAAIGTRFGQSGGEVWRPWSFQILGVLRGPMWYDTEEVLLIPLGEPSSTFIHRKDTFWVWNLRGEVEAFPGVKFFGAVNNLFDINQHPIFIALDQFPCIAAPASQNGACGNSMPGREFIVGFQGRF
jgi:vitamin B12 transporter